MLTISNCGNINCLALHRAKLLVCGDDGQQVAHAEPVSHSTRSQYESLVLEYE